MSRLFNSEKKQTSKTFNVQLSFCHKRGFLNPYICATHRRPLIFQTVNSARSNSLKFELSRFKQSGCKDIGIKKFEFMARTQLIWIWIWLFTQFKLILLLTRTNKWCFNSKPQKKKNQLCILVPFLADFLKTSSLRIINV